MSQNQDAFEKSRDVANVSRDMSMSVLCSLTCHVTRIFQSYCPDFQVPVLILACLLHRQQTSSKHLAVHVTQDIMSITNLYCKTFNRHHLLPQR